ncbi:microtubule-associated protein 10 [Fukomys damarensis]|uniref:microtubule-associated protein 10 n=1 Tax=Fukomys damarensis TaxID=885580 RepID=UPI0005401E53|nr:microtubule-associated protein 10 [Fukomys damarensis]
MAALESERLFSLELLVDWVRLEAGPSSPGAPRPAVSFCLLDFPRTFALLSQTGERIGDLALFYRLTDLGGSQLGSPEPPASLASSAGAEGTVVGQKLRPMPHLPREKRRPSSAPELRPRDTDQAAGTPAALQDDRKGVFRALDTSDTTGCVKSLRTHSAVAPPAGSSGKSVSPLDEKVAELDFETNTFCPPPLYYTHLTPKKTPPARIKIITEPQINVPVQLDGSFPEKSLVNSPANPSPVKLTNSATQERAGVLVSPPHSQDIEASNQTTCPPQIEQNTINTIRQLPLLNALLIELSLLYNQPMASPTHVHPHLSWLYRTQDKIPESYAKSTESESKKHQLSVGQHKKSVSLQYKKNQTEKLKKDKYLEKSNENSQVGVTRRRLLYGLTNTLRLRLKKTNPDMLVVQEKREHYRKMQAQMLGTKCRITPSKIKEQLFAEQSQQPQLPENNYLGGDASLVENSNTSKQISGVFGEPSVTEESKLKQATEERTGDCKNRTKNGILGGIRSPENSIIPERFTHTNILGGKLVKRVQSPYVFQQDAVDRTLDKEIGGWQVKTTGHDVLGADMSENRPSKNSFCESISELKYSDDFTSPCYSEDFHTTEGTSRSLISLQAPDSSSGAENPKHGSDTSKSSEARLSERKNSDEKSSILSPPFSAGSPVLSKGRSYFSKNQGRSLEETSSISIGNLSSSYSTEEKESQMDQNGMCNSKVIKRGQGVTIKGGTSGKSLERSHSPRTSQLSSYLPSNLSELELKDLDSSTSDHFGEDDDDIGPLSISKQCKDICELVINKLPGYTV